MLVLRQAELIASDGAPSMASPYIGERIRLNFRITLDLIWVMAYCMADDRD